MKRIKYIVFVFLISIIGIGAVKAASLSMSVSSKNITVGSNVKVTVKATGAAGWEYCLNYDTSLFKLTGGDKCIIGSTLMGNQSVTFTLKSLKAGTGTFKLGTVSMLDDNANELKFTQGSATVTVKAQSDISINPKTDAPQSDNAYLKLLEVVGYELSPTFKKDVVSYTVEVPNEVEEVEINARVEDTGKAKATAVPSIEGKVKLNEGANKVVITVQAENGNKKTYTLSIKREETAPIKVTVDGKEYTVLRSLEGVEKPKYFVEGTHEVEGNEVPALTNDVTGYTLVALKDVEGNVALFAHSGKEFTKYFEINDEVLTLIPKDVVNLVKGYEERKEIDINGNKVKVYYKDANSDFVLLYAMNVSNGETMWYTYDIKEGTLQRYNEEEPVKEEGKGIYLYLAIGFAILAGIALLIVFLMMGLNNRLRKKNEKLVKKMREQKVKVIEHPVFDTEMAVESWKHMSDDDSMYDDESFFAREQTPEGDINTTVEIKSDSFGDEEPKKKRRSSRKEAKAKKEAEEAELKAMREDFLKTRELEITKELQAVDEPKKGKKKTSRKKKK